MILLVWLDCISPIFLHLFLKPLPLEEEFFSFISNFVKDILGFVSKLIKWDFSSRPKTYVEIIFFFVTGSTEKF